METISLSQFGRDSTPPSQPNWTFDGHAWHIWKMGRDHSWTECALPVFLPISMSLMMKKKTKIRVVIEPTYLTLIIAFEGLTESGGKL